MLDPERLTTPPGHGDVLIEPPLREWPGAIERNQRLLAEARFPLLDRDLNDVRRQTRAELGIADDAPAILLGHQPEFFHCGVWAKHVTSAHVARSLNGHCINLVVDNDAPHDGFLRVPVESSEHPPKIANLRYARFQPGVAYESFGPLDGGEIDEFERSVRDALGRRFGESLMPVFFDGLRRAAPPRDWVEQIVTARRCVEARFDVRPQDVRVSSAWGGPLLFDMLANARRFARAYNSALAAYRQARGIRNTARPIPDLHIDGSGCEVPVWVYRLGEVRRRLFVENRADRVVLLAEQQPVGEIPVVDLQRVERASAAIATLDGFCLRPRALTLTLWARLLAADLFVHGIGGAKYDAMTDDLMRRYYGVAPPAIACVSATLHLDIPHPHVSVADLLAADRALRDNRWNPQRHISTAPDLGDLFELRSASVKRSDDLRQRAPRNHPERRAAFASIRELNEQILARRPEALEQAGATLGQLSNAMKMAAVGEDRGWFFALLPPSSLQMLVRRCTSG